MKRPGLFLRDRYVTVSYEPEFPDLPDAFDGFTAVFLSDLHGKTFGQGNETLVRDVVEADPDAVFIGGDMTVVRKKTVRGTEALNGLLSGIRDRFPVYYAEGNHEHRMADRFREEWMAALLRNHVKLLSNETAEIRRGNDSIRIAGVTLPENCFRKFRKAPLGKEWFRETLGGKEEFTVLLLHSPSYFDEAADYGAELVLSGHYHGGTIRIGGRGLMTPDFVFFERRVRGLFERKGKKLIVSAGLGTHSINLRVNDPPELVKITLRKTK